LSRRAVALFFLSVALIYYTGWEPSPSSSPTRGGTRRSEGDARPGDFVTPHLNGVVYLEKPPLFYWGNAVSFALSGERVLGAALHRHRFDRGGAPHVLDGDGSRGSPGGLFSAMVLCTSLYTTSSGGSTPST